MARFRYMPNNGWGWYFGGAKFGEDGRIFRKPVKPVGPGPGPGPGGECLELLNNEGVLDLLNSEDCLETL